MTGLYYSVFAYDTAVGSGTLKTLILADNLQTPGTGQAELRFLALSPNANATNVTLINGTDTVTFKNAGYIGTTSYNPDSLAAYTVINPGTYRVAINNVDNINMLNADSYGHYRYQCAQPGSHPAKLMAVNFGLLAAEKCGLSRRVLPTS
jgi:hypothetical protein